MDVGDALVEVGRVEEVPDVATAVLAAIQQEAGPYADELSRGLSLTEVATLLARAGRPEEALLLARQAGSSREVAIGQVATVLAEAGNDERALAIAMGEVAHYWREHVLRDIANALAQAGKQERALAVASQIEDGYYRSLALSSIAVELLGVGRRQEADRVVQEAMEAASVTADARARASALIDVARVLIQERRANDAWHVTEEALSAARQADPGFRDVSLADVSEAMAEAGMTPLAFATAGEIGNALARANALAQVASTDALLLAQTGTKQEVQKAVAQAREYASKGSFDSTKCPIFRKLAEAFAHIRSFREARLTAEGCMSSTGQLRVYTAILREYTIQHHPESKTYFALANE
jgi:hypothetical protein